MPYEGNTDRWHRRLRYGYTSNTTRHCYTNSLKDYETDVAYYARRTKSNMKEHCAILLEVLANPTILDSGLEYLDWKRNLFRDDINHSEYSLRCDKWIYLRNLGYDIKHGNFKPGKYKKVSIPKIGKEGFRWIEVPPFETRIVARSITNLLSPIIDPDFYPLSVGFRPRRGIFHGLAAATMLYNSGAVHMISVDIRDAFGSVSINRCFQLLESRLYKSPIIPMIRALNGKDRKHGLIQGISCSPLLLNLYLDANLDKWLEKYLKNFYNAMFIRYADDIAIFCSSRFDASKIYDALVKRLTVIGCPAKETVDEAIKSIGSKETANWLGFQLADHNRQLKFSLTDLAWDKLEHRLAEAKNKIALDIGLELDETVEQLVVSWLEQKAPGIQFSELNCVINRLTVMLEKYGFSLCNLCSKTYENILNRGVNNFNNALASTKKWPIWSQPSTMQLNFS